MTLKQPFPFRETEEISSGDLFVFILWNSQGHILIMNRQVLTEYTRRKLVRQSSKSVPPALSQLIKFPSFVPLPL